MEKIVILGDSISEGIGKKMINYEKHLMKMLNNRFSIINLAHTGTTIDYVNDIYDKLVQANPNYALIFYGNVDAQVRANIWGNKTNIAKFIPKRYKHNGMLDPRPFYSKKWYRFIPDRIDNYLRYIFKKIVIYFEGTTQWVPLHDFEIKYEEIIKKMIKNNIKPIIVSTTYLDDNFFLNSNNEYEKYNLFLKKMANKYDCIFVDLYNKLKKEVTKNGFEKLYSFDHFHPNENGYIFIAQTISDSLKI